MKRTEVTILGLRRTNLYEYVQDNITSCITQYTLTSRDRKSTEYRTEVQNEHGIKTCHTPCNSTGHSLIT